MPDLSYELKAFINEILYLIDKGEVISIENLEAIYDENNIVNFVRQRYGFKSSNSFVALEKAFEDGKAPYLSKTSGRDAGFERNGFVYLVSLLINWLEVEGSPITEEIGIK